MVAMHKTCTQHLQTKIYTSTMITVASQPTQHKKATRRARENANH